MQRALRMNDVQLLSLAEKALQDNCHRGYLCKRAADSSRWHLRWFVLYQNLLFYFENNETSKPSGVVFLEGSYCERLLTPHTTGKNNHAPTTQYCFTISYRREGSRVYELKAETEQECDQWVNHIETASFSKMLLQKEELEQKHLHLVQIVESEKTAKWQYAQQCEELSAEIKKLRAELCALKKEWRITTPNRFGVGSSVTCGSAGNIGTAGNGYTAVNDRESEEIKKIKKVQSFFRGWLCRRRWKQIVAEYISSPHAENMRKRNSLVFRMVEAEEEYVEQLQLLVSCFLRPFKMAASSQKPPCSHDEVNSIFLNSETLMFLHQIFLKGLTARMESWPTLVLGDLFDMLLPMLTIYQEYVRNHHYSLQVLAECKQRDKFASILQRLEDKTVLQGRTLEAFLTYPMHQVPRYIITLHELLAHTPHNHVERRSLENARTKLEELSRQMHDEVSETENIRKNLAIERMIIGGCDILLDVNQVFVRQGNVILAIPDRASRRPRITASKQNDQVRQCYLFTNHMLLCTRTSGGKLHLVEGIGKIPLADATLIEDPNEQFQFTVSDDGEGSVSSLSCSASQGATSEKEKDQKPERDYQGMDFKIIVDYKAGPPVTVHLVAPTVQEKAAWTSDISQCIDNVHFNDLFHGTMSDSSSVTMPQSIRNDPRLFKDDVDIRFSRTLNSCKLPQIRYASPDRLFERLTDLRFLSIDFLNTFLLTYRVFTDGVKVLEALKRVHYNPDLQMNQQDPMMGAGPMEEGGNAQGGDLAGMLVVDYDYSRRISTGSMLSECGDHHADRSGSIVSTAESIPLPRLLGAQQQQHWRLSYRKFEEDQLKEQSLKRIKEASPLSPSGGTQPESMSVPVPPPPTPEPASKALHAPIAVCESLSDTSSITGQTITPDASSSPEAETPKAPASPTTENTGGAGGGSAPSTPTNCLSSTASTCTLIGSGGTPSPHRKHAPMKLPSLDENKVHSSSQQQDPGPPTPPTPPLNPITSATQTPPSALKQVTLNQSPARVVRLPASPASSNPLASSQSSPNVMSYLRVQRGAQGKRGSSDTEGAVVSANVTPRSSFQTESTILSSTPRSSFQYPDSPQHSSKAGVVVTSSRTSARRSSTASAAAAFAVATAGSSNPPEPLCPAVNAAVQAALSQPASRAGSRLPSQVGADLKIPNLGPGNTTKAALDAYLARAKRESMISTAATMRVLNVLRHWISKHSQDFEDETLYNMTVEFLTELNQNTTLLPAEQKAASQLLQMMQKLNQNDNKVDLNLITAHRGQPSKETVETLSALEIAEGMTYLDHKIFISIRSEEFLGQRWMKPEKAKTAPNILMMTTRFNEMSRLVVSEIMRCPEMSRRVSIIEKWAAVADICRCLHNYNGVLQICAAFMNSSVFRLKKTWERVSKTTRTSIDKLQALVSADGRFRNMRDALHRSDPPCIPYLGMYLTDLSFIEEGTPNFTDEGLLNFSKMRMIAHVIREIRHFQQTPYKIDNNPRVLNYLLDSSRLMPDEELYRLSLCLEPRLSRLGTKVPPTSVASTGSTSGTTYAGTNTLSTTQHA